MVRTDVKAGLRIIPPVMLLSGAVLQAMAFPSWSLAGLAWVSLVPLMFCAVNWRPNRAFLLGWIHGTVCGIISFSWVTYSMTVYGGLSWLVSGFALTLMASFLGLFPATAVWMAESLHKRYGDRFHRAVLWPVAWVSMEYIRAHLPFGLAFPWNSLGQSQHNVPYILQNADWGSFYGISALIVLVNAGIHEVLTRTKLLLRVPLTAILILAAAVSYGAFRWHRTRETPTFRVGIIQGNVDLNEKWEPASRLATLENHLRLSRRLLPENPNLLLWSESSISFLYRYAWRYNDNAGGNLGSRLDSFLEEARVPLLTGTLDRIDEDVFNAVVLALPDGRNQYFYKQRLVPFGEYVPIKDLFFFVNRLVKEEIGEFSPGTSVEPLSVPGGPSLAVTICYENIFPDLVRKRVVAGGQVICNVTNDAWFGRTSAAQQHFSAARFRAVENRRPVVRCANTGISGAVDSAGRIIARSDLFESSAFTVDLAPGTGSTLYMILGDWFASACIIIITVLYLRIATGFHRFHRRKR